MRFQTSVWRLLSIARELFWRRRWVLKRSRRGSCESVRVWVYRSRSDCSGMKRYIYRIAGKFDGELKYSIYLYQLLQFLLFPHQNTCTHTPHTTHHTRTPAHIHIHLTTHACTNQWSWRTERPWKPGLQGRPLLRSYAVVQQSHCLVSSFCQNKACCLL